MKQNKGISQILVMVIMLVLAIALPLTTKLVQNVQENRSKAGTISTEQLQIGCVAECKKNYLSLYPTAAAFPDVVNAGCGIACASAVNTACNQLKTVTDITAGTCYATCMTNVLKDASKCFSLCKSYVDAKTVTCGETATSQFGTECGSTGGNKTCQTGQMCSYGYCRTDPNACGAANPNGTCPSSSQTCRKDANQNIYYCQTPDTTTCTAAEATGKVICRSNAAYSSAVYKYCSGSTGANVYVRTCANGCFDGACSNAPTAPTNPCSGRAEFDSCGTSKFCRSGVCVDQPTDCTNLQGQCTTTCSGGSFVSLKCRGTADNVKCCVPSTPPVAGTDDACGSKNGTCAVWETSTVGGSCNGGNGTIEKGLCMSQPTNTAYRCCVPNPVAPAPVCTPNCSCGASTLVGQTCSNGCDGTCPGTKQLDCVPNCSCAASTLVGQTCTNSCGTGTCPGTKAAPVVIPTCTFDYSGWSACASNGTQSRTVTGTSPAGCNGGTQILSQNCTYVAPIVSKVSFKFSMLGVKPNATCMANVGKLAVEVANVVNIDTAYQSLSTAFTAIDGETDTSGNQIFKVTDLALDTNKFGSVSNRNFIKIKGASQVKGRMCVDGQTTKLGENSICNLDLTRTDNYVYNFAKYSTVQKTEETDVTVYGLLPGDINQDGIVNSIDFSIIKGALSSKIECGQKGDLDLNGKVNALDVSLLKGSLLSRDDE